MSTDEYVPSGEDIEEFYALGRIEWSPGSDITPASARDELQTWLARVRREAKAEAWDEGHSWGWSDAQDAHDVRQAMDRADWTLRTPNPYKETDR